MARTTKKDTTKITEIATKLATNIDSAKVDVVKLDAVKTDAVKTITKVAKLPKVPKVPKDPSVSKVAKIPKVPKVPDLIEVIPAKKVSKKSVDKLAKNKVELDDEVKSDIKLEDKIVEKEIKQEIKHETSHHEVKQESHKSPVIVHEKPREILQNKTKNSNLIEVKKIYTPKTFINPEACIDINEGMPMKAMPTKCLPELIGASIVASEPTPKDAKKIISKKDGMKQALDILDEYYKDTPPRDPRFPQHEE